MTRPIRTALLLAALLTGGCTTQPKPSADPKPAAVKPKPPAAVVGAPSTKAKPCGPCAPCAPCPPTQPEAEAPAVTPNLSAAEWTDLPGWQQDDLLSAWPAWLQSCSALKKRPEWQPACTAAMRLNPRNAESVRAYFETGFSLYQSRQPDGGENGLVTGYYEPLLRGNRTRTAQYAVPLYRTPVDMVAIDLASVYPRLKNMRLRGRIQGNKVVPYLSRAEIDGSAHPLRGNELVWVDNPVEAFFLQIQGSGRVLFEDGGMMRIGYADQNGYPYQSIGRVLAERGEMRLEQTSMQNIKAWAANNPDKLPELLAQNPSYVFFRTLPGNGSGPLGALGVPITGERSIAVDRRAIPLGAPVWLATTIPFSEQPLARLVVAQDTGGAIRGNVRADYFWGFGDEAGKKAGMMKQQGRMWVMLPKGMPVPGE